MHLRWFSFAALIGLLASTPAEAEITECTEIMSVPIVISVQGIYCLKGNLVTNITSGHAIDIQTNNVTIDFNGFKLGGSAAGDATSASGIYAAARTNITIRNGIIRGFRQGVQLNGASGTGHLIEKMRIDGNKWNGLRVWGTNIVIRENQIINTGNGSLGTEASGILVGVGSNMVITGNIIGDTEETGIVSGINLESVSIATVSDNQILNSKNALTRYGIRVSNSDNISLVNNQIINNGGGTTALNEGGASTGVDCVGNIIRGYAAGASACDYSSGNFVN